MSDLISSPKPLSRRDFIKLSEAISMGLILSACGVETTQSEPLAASATPLTTTETPTDHATLEPTSAEPTAATPTPYCFEQLSQNVMVRGQQYIALVPETLDLHENAILAINALTRCTNPDSNFDVYFYGDARRNPPVMQRLMSFYGKFWEALALMRHLTGKSDNEYVDQIWREAFLKRFRDEKPALEGPDGGRLLCWLANNYKFEKKPCWAQIGEEAIEILSDNYTHNRDYCYFSDEKSTMLTGWDATYQGWTLQGVTRIYSITGSTSARKLADELARYLKDHAQIFDTNGNFLARHPSVQGPALHFHHNGNTMTALSEYALATGNPEFVDFVQKGYEYGRSVGWPLVGFFPEYIKDWPDPRPYIDCETCCTVDMIIMAINLSKLHKGDYWDDVDRYVRNQFTEMQMKSGAWIGQISANYLTTPVEIGEDGDNIAERVVGSFSGWATANDFIASEGEPFISGCCTGNGARAIFQVWENMLEFNDETLRIHLLLNRASPWADLNSYVPFDGQIDVVMKTYCKVYIRIPEWVKPEEVSCFVNNIPRDIVIQRRYVYVGSAEMGNVVTMKFPISERTEKTSIGGVPYTLMIKGNDVVSIDPSGHLHPFYQRKHYRGQVRWTQRERFVPTI